MAVSAIRQLSRTQRSCIVHSICHYLRYLITTSCAARWPPQYAPAAADRRPISGQFVVRGQELPMAYVRAKFEDRSFIRLRNIGTFRCAALIDPVTLTFNLLTLKSVWESHVTWDTPVQSFVFLGLLVFELEPMYATSDRQTTDADHRLMPPRLGHNNVQ